MRAALKADDPAACRRLAFRLCSTASCKSSAFSVFIFRSWPAAAAFLAFLPNTGTWSGSRLRFGAPEVVAAIDVGGPETEGAAAWEEVVVDDEEQDVAVDGVTMGMVTLVGAVADRVGAVVEVTTLVTGTGGGTSGVLLGFGLCEGMGAGAGGLGTIVIAGEGSQGCEEMVGSVSSK
mmetsp:Transcript_9264/g.17397  ORF Transcript_9264/g.17397 Transcript_9264/m.17397 type:complete len:177 (-) Transcript_9264:568-1098(-)